MAKKHKIHITIGAAAPLNSDPRVLISIFPDAARNNRTRDKATRAAEGSHNDDGHVPDLQVAPIATRCHATTWGLNAARICLGSNDSEPSSRRPKDFFRRPFHNIWRCTQFGGAALTFAIICLERLFGRSLASSKTVIQDSTLSSWRWVSVAPPTALMIHRLVAGSQDTKIFNLTLPVHICRHYGPK
jgi:hypothetical protein